MLAGLLKVSGLLILKIVYGSHLQEKISSSQNGMTATMVLFSMLNIFWILCIAIFLTEDKREGIEFLLAICIAYPVAIAIWAIITRRKYNSAPKDAETNSDNK